VGRLVLLLVGRLVLLLVGRLVLLLCSHGVPIELPVVMAQPAMLL